MPPRLQLLRACTRPILTTTCAPLPIAPFLAPVLLRSGVSHQSRNASILSSISDNKEAYNKRIRVGRGPASGKGKTSGRGHKGQNQHGKVPKGFNGGQTREAITSPPRGTGNQIHHFTIDLVPLNVDRIQQWIDQGRLDPTKPITMKELQKSRCTHGVKDGVKLLARNAEQLRTPVNIVVSRASAGAIAAIEAVGGTVTTRFYTRPAIRRILTGQTDPINSLLSAFPPQIAETTSSRQWAYRLPDATSRTDLEYYRDPAHRGYLSHMLSENEGPSLFYNVDRRKGKRNAMSDRDAAAAAKKKSSNKVQMLF